MKQPADLPSSRNRLPKNRPRSDWRRGNFAPSEFHHVLLQRRLRRLKTVAPSPLSTTCEHDLAITYMFVDGEMDDDDGVTFLALKLF